MMTDCRWRVCRTFFREAKACGYRPVHCRRGYRGNGVVPLFCCSGVAIPAPHRHESAPYTQSLYQTIIGSWLAYVQIEGSRLQRLYVGFFDWQQIQVDAVIESVPAIPTMFPNILFNISASFAKYRAMSGIFRQSAR